VVTGSILLHAWQQKASDEARVIMQRELPGLGANCGGCNEKRQPLDAKGWLSIFFPLACQRLLFCASTTSSALL
jgi:hypothetical protein